MLFPGALLTAVCLIMNICVRNILTPVCLTSRCLADSSVPDMNICVMKILTPVCVNSRCVADGSVSNHRDV